MYTVVKISKSIKEGQDANHKDRRKTNHWQDKEHISCDGNQSENIAGTGTERHDGSHAIDGNAHQTESFSLSKIGHGNDDS